MADEDDDLGRPLRGVVEVEWDGWDDDHRPSRVRWIVAVVVLVMTGIVAALVVWAVGSDADLPRERPVADTAS